MSTVIAAGRERVWRALTEPAEIVCWDEHVLAPVDVPASYPTPGERVRWRFQQGKIPGLLHDCPEEVIPGEFLSSTLVAGSFRMRRSYSLVEEREDRAQAARTRVAMKLTAENTVPLVSGVFDRFQVRQLTIEQIDETLRALQKHCEND